MKTFLVIGLLFCSTSLLAVVKLAEFEGRIQNYTELKNSDFTLTLEVYRKKQISAFSSKAGYRLEKMDRLTRTLKVNSDGRYYVPSMKINNSRPLYMGISVNHRKEMITNSRQYIEGKRVDLPLNITNIDQVAYENHFGKIALDRYDLGFQDVVKIITPEGQSVRQYIGELLASKASNATFDCWDLETLSYINNKYTSDVKGAVRINVANKVEGCRPEFKTPIIGNKNSDLSSEVLALQSKPVFVASSNRNWRFDLVAMVEIKLNLYSNGKRVGGFNLLTNRDMNEQNGNCEYVGRFQHIKCQMNPLLTEISLLHPLDLTDYYLQVD